jgi:hypothetical protein
MGIYLYSVRAKSIEVAGLKVHALEYLTKPYYDYGDRMDKTSNMLAGKAEAFWAGKAKPEFVTFVSKGKFEEFQAVMSWDGRAVDLDTPSFEGAKSTLGFLKRVGKKGWTLASEVFNVTLGTLKEGTIAGRSCLYIRTSGEFFTAEEATAFVTATKLEGEHVQVTRSRIEDGKCLTTLLAPTWFERLTAA